MSTNASVDDVVAALEADGFAVVEGVLSKDEAAAIRSELTGILNSTRHVPAVPQDVVRMLPERLLELLGYNIHPPFVGYVDGRHPRRVLEAQLAESETNV